jgi:hypothetical protein
VIPIGIDNYSLLDALKEQPVEADTTLEKGGKVFEAFLIPRKCESIQYYAEVEEPDEDD